MEEMLEEMKGQVFTDVSSTDDELIFTSESGKQYKFYHCQDCCEDVSIEDISGDLNDLVGKPLVVAEEVSNHPYEKEWEDSLVTNEYGGKEEPDGGWVDDSYTWTFYKFATINGYVDVRWFGSSNGYYSESVDAATAEPGESFEYQS